MIDQQSRVSNKKTFLTPVNKTIIQTDASKKDYGAFCRNVSIGGQWTLQESDLHINVLESNANKHSFFNFLQNVLLESGTLPSRQPDCTIAAGRWQSFWKKLESLLYPKRSRLLRNIFQGNSMSGQIGLQRIFRIPCNDSCFQKFSHDQSKMGDPRNRYVCFKSLSSASSLNGSKPRNRWIWVSFMPSTQNLKISNRWI